MSALEFVSAFFSPTYLFLFLNLIIGTIFLTSRLTRPAKSHPSPLARAPSSLIDRVRSINLSLYKFDAHHEADPAQHYHPGPAWEVADDGSPPPPPLARAPSLLDRLRSVDFYQHKFENINPEPPQPHRVETPAPPARAASTLLDRLKSMNYYYQKFEQLSDPPHEADQSTDAQDAAPLARAPSSLLERVRSIKFPSLYDPDHHDEDGNQRVKDTGHGAVRRIRSESERMGEEQGKGRKARMRKTVSEKSVGEEGVGAEEINAKADDFIQKFRQQLRLQRLDSIMRYKDMLTGGGR